MNKKKFFAFILTSLASCSNHAFDAYAFNETKIETNSGLNKFFRVEKIADDFVCTGSGNCICTDLDGNFYYLAQGVDMNMQEVKKYNPKTRKVTSFISITLGMNQSGDIDLIESFCIDSHGDLYYTSWNNKLVKVSVIDQSITELNQSIPVDPQESDILSGLVMAEDGNVFFSGGVYDRKEKIFKITPKGTIVKVAEYDREKYRNLRSSSLFKCKGSYVYAWVGKEYLKINTTNGNIEEYLSVHSPVQIISATYSQNNPYALQGYNIVRLRPNQDSDLLIGTIPSNVIGNDNLISMNVPVPGGFCMNAEATVFYVVGYDNYNLGSCYKLTLE